VYSVPEGSQRRSAASECLKGDRLEVIAQMGVCRACECNGDLSQAEMGLGGSHIHSRQHDQRNSRVLTFTSNNVRGSRTISNIVVDNRALGSLTLL